MSSFVVAIDGPAASGKSTTARLVAERLGILYLDTGAMYRAITWAALAADVSLSDEEALTYLAQATRLEIRHDRPGGGVFVNDEDVTEAIREPRVSRAVSQVARVPGVRRALVSLQREIGETGEFVVEGRDIGTVVFPQAPVKIFLSASLEERARRRREELLKNGIAQELEDLVDEIRARDAADSARDDSPLRQAEDAVVVDTTGQSIESQVNEVVEIVEKMRSR